MDAWFGLTISKESYRPERRSVLLLESHKNDASMPLCFASGNIDDLEDLLIQRVKDVCKEVRNNYPEGGISAYFTS